MSIAMFTGLLSLLVITPSLVAHSLSLSFLLFLQTQTRLRLGHLVASILINSTPSLKRINENGIKKMCRNIFAIQQNLTNITMSREADLDHARQYYEIMYQTVRGNI